MKTVIFRVEKNYDLPFRTGVTYSLDNLVEVDWEVKDSVQLTRSLNQEIIKNYIWFKLISEYCTYPKYYKYEESIPILKIKEGFNMYRIYEREKLCRKNSINLSAYTDLFNRDEKAMLRKEGQEELFAAVLLKDNIYLGHVYIWISPSGEYGFMMGIRTNILMNYELNSINFKGVSYYLIDAVRKFFISKNINNFVVPYPIGGMQNKLEQFGFEYKVIDGSDIGNAGIMYKGPPCEKCMVKRDIKDWVYNIKNFNHVIFI
jgi:hypothetical protein